MYLPACPVWRDGRHPPGRHHPLTGPPRQTPLGRHTPWEDTQIWQTSTSGRHPHLSDNHLADTPIWQTPPICQTPPSARHPLGQTTPLGRHYHRPAWQTSPLGTPPPPPAGTPGQTPPLPADLLPPMDSDLCRHKSQHSYLDNLRHRAQVPYC